VTTTPIVALDVPDERRAIALVERLGDRCDFYKVGLELFTAEGPAILRVLRDLGKRVFLDLKLHDIPNTVRAAARRAAGHGADLLTVHASGGEDMLRAAVEGAGEGCGILAVTVLTSLDAAGLAMAWGKADVSLTDEVVRLAGVALACQAHGVVCSGAEVAAIRAFSGDRLAPLVPGIRFVDGDQHDQRRVVSPAAAAAAGARYIVLGRAVTGAPDPAASMLRVHGELAASLG